MPRPRKPASPFRYFNSWPEIIRLVVLMYVLCGWLPRCKWRFDDLVHWSGAVHNAARL